MPGRAKPGRAAPEDPEQERIRSGEARPLEGIPVGVKELEDACGFRSTNASLPFKDAMPEQDSAQVERLRAAGAIIAGKTNAPEFGYTAITKNLIFGVSRSPWNPDKSPGGSSGGSSAAIAGGALSTGAAPPVASRSELVSVAALAAQLASGGRFPHRSDCRSAADTLES